MSFIFLLQGVAMDMDLCEQIEKISHFVDHYQDHREYDGDSFFEYVVEDYFNTDGDKEGHHTGSEEDKIPSHTHNQCCHPIVFVAPANSVAIKSIRFENSIEFGQYPFHFNSRFLDSLYQPPKA
ncbi:hypothetical protein [Arenibacter palladensis]|uniref:hypothetical protein n=1 Tax=Arenibacter palladensis TaxID=237373 RepID=UPI0026E3240C|nr:hypothetical protein [Arenibacter palladensis]MDO6601500.1 hypothetical protein [Arenibacter palladensis]